MPGLALRFRCFFPAFCHPYHDREFNLANQEVIYHNSILCDSADYGIVSDTSYTHEGETGAVSIVKKYLLFPSLSSPQFSMAAKKIKTLLKLNLPAGKATAAPPVGPALGQHGLAIMEFVKAYNERTAKLEGQIIPAVITVFEDRTFTFVTKLPPVSAMIKKTLGLDKGGGKAGRQSAGKLTKTQVEQIAKDKLGDLNTDTVAAAMKVVAGTARSMGIETE